MVKCDKCHRDIEELLGPDINSMHGIISAMFDFMQFLHLEDQISNNTYEYILNKLSHLKLAADEYDERHNQSIDSLEISDLKNTLIKLEAKINETKERHDQLEKTNFDLREAFHAAINSPKGTVPKHYDRFYDPNTYKDM